MRKTGSITYVGRGFTPRQAGPEGPPYGYEIDQFVIAVHAVIWSIAASSGISMRTRVPVPGWLVRVNWDVAP